MRSRARATRRRCRCSCSISNDIKRVNDTFGHPAGDEVLRTVGEKLRVSSATASTSPPGTRREFAVILLHAGTPETGGFGRRRQGERGAHPGARSPGWNCLSRMPTARPNTSRPAWAWLMLPATPTSSSARRIRLSTRKRRGTAWSCSLGIGRRGGHHRACCSEDAERIVPDAWRLQSAPGRAQMLTGLAGWSDHENDGPQYRARRRRSRRVAGAVAVLALAAQVAEALSCSECCIYEYLPRARRRSGAESGLTDRDREWIGKLNRLADLPGFDTVISSRQILVEDAAPMPAPTMGYWGELASLYAHRARRRSAGHPRTHREARRRTFSEDRRLVAQMSGLAAVALANARESRAAQARNLQLQCSSSRRAR